MQRQCLVAHIQPKIGTFDKLSNVKIITDTITRLANLGGVILLEKTIKQIMVVILVCSFTSLCGCSTGKPSDADLTNDLQNWLKEGEFFRDNFKLLQCIKTNGIDKDKGSYEIEFTGSVELLSLIYFKDDYGGYYSTTPFQEDYRHRKVYTTEKGTIAMFNGRALYEQTERGWRLKNYSIKMINKHVPNFEKSR